jgi:hypothetical protein
VDAQPGQGDVSAVIVALDDSIRVSADEFATEWNSKFKLSMFHAATASDHRPSEVFLPEVIEFVAIPGAVGLTTSMLYDSLKAIATKLYGRGRQSREPPLDLEIVEVRLDCDETVVVIRRMAIERRGLK